MHYKHVSNGALEPFSQNELADHCRDGVYVCCNSAGEGHGGDCGLHLWIWKGPDPIPHHHYLKQLIKKEVPHCNGNGAHE